MTGRQLVDSSAAVPPAAAVADGIAGVIRYVSLEPSKNLTAAEAAAYHAAGMTVNAVYEDGTSDYEGGQAAGEAHGKAAKAILDAIGYPDDRGLIVAVDTDIQPADYPLGLEYVQATATFAGRVAGAYGPDAFVRYCMANGVRYGMNAAAWSDGAPNAAQIQQGLPPFEVDGVQCDPDVATAPDYGQWPYTPPVPPPAVPPCLAACPVARQAGKGWFLFPDGAVEGRDVAGGSIPAFGDLLGKQLAKPVVTIASSPTGRGYWIAAEDGGVFNFGDADFHGSAAADHLNKPVVSLVPTASGGGYVLVAADGGVFAFGDAKYDGSAASIDLHAPIVAATAPPDGKGYWLVGADGGVFSLGGAKFHGSALSPGAAAPATGIAACGAGYVVGRRDGSVVALGTPQHSDYPSLPPDQREGVRRFVAVAGEADGSYTLFGNDGTQYHFA